MLGTESWRLGNRLMSAAATINEADATVVASTCPSGFDADGGNHAENRVEADRVVTFHDAKPGWTTRGRGHRRGYRHSDRGGAALSALGTSISHGPTGRAGRPYIIGGGPYTGAPALAAQVALRASAELLRRCARVRRRRDSGYSEDLIVQPYESDVLTPERAEDLRDGAQQYDNVVVLGPGSAPPTRPLEAARQFLESYTGRVVVDADALAVVP